MIDRPSGKVAYAIMSFGGFLGMGNQYHPLPWSVLKYDTNLGGYVVNLDKRQLEGAGLLRRRRTGMGELREELIELDARIGGYDRKIRELYRNSEICQRLGQGRRDQPSDSDSAGRCRWRSKLVK